MSDNFPFKTIKYCFFTGGEVTGDQAASHRGDRQEHCSDGDRQEGAV